MYRQRQQLAQVIDPGNVHVALVPEVVALDASQVHHDFFAHQVHQVFQMVLGAPVGLDAEETVAENGAPHVVVVGFDAVRLIGQLVGEEQWQVGLEVITFAFAKLIEQRGCPGYGAVVVRLIAEETQHRLAEFGADRLLVRLVGDGHESAGGVRIQVIDQGIPGILVTGSVLAVKHAGGGTPVDMAHKHDVPEPIRGIWV